ncbi:MAG: Prephenate dehydrogenase [Alphaproteobacteria bacterium MarineAlpha9_Bin2]|nr:MAG: Prephenate dehydrogenase [Alphaproteobacteria bacterium MarineAlpha9_Bin2]
MTSVKLFKTIAFIGFGLINSSLARVVKTKGLAEKIHAYSRSEATRAKIKKLNIVDNIYDNSVEAVKGADLVILGIPVGATRDTVNTFASSLSPGTIITDVGSVKKSVIDKLSSVLPENINFVPAHPIAGTEKSGPEAGFETLFEGHWCIITPTKNTDKEAIKKVTKIWESAGMQVAEMDAQYHDLVLAITSHIPHLVAYSIVGTVAELEDHLKTEVIKYAAGGFRDFTRIAGSDPVMWRDIFIDNKEAVLEMLGRFIEDLTALQKSIRWEDKEALESLFNKTRLIRKGVVALKQD